VCSRVCVCVCVCIDARRSMEDHCAADGAVRGPAAVYSYLSRVMYNRRSEARWGGGGA
jgi:hypothetical protein